MMRRFLYLICLLLCMLALISCRKKSDNGNSPRQETVARQDEISNENYSQITPTPGVSPQPSITSEEKTDQNDEVIQSNDVADNAKVYYPVGIDIDEFIKRFNEVIEDSKGYQISDLNIKKGGKYNTFEYEFPNQEVLTGIVNQNDDFLYLEYKYPARTSSDKDITYARQMVCASSIIAFTQNSATTDIAVEQSTEIMKQLSIIKDNEDIYNKYVNEELLMAICDGIKYTRQLDKKTDITCFTMSAADEETETVNIEYEVKTAIEDAENDYYSTKDSSGLNEYQKQAMDYYLGGQKEVPAGWIEYKASLSWLLDDITYGLSIYHNGKYYTSEKRMEELAVQIN